MVNLNREQERALSAVVRAESRRAEGEATMRAKIRALFDREQAEIDILQAGVDKAAAEASRLGVPTRQIALEGLGMKYQGKAREAILRGAEMLDAPESDEPDENDETVTVSADMHVVEPGLVAYMHDGETAHFVENNGAVIPADSENPGTWENPVVIRVMTPGATELRAQILRLIQGA